MYIMIELLWAPAMAVDHGSRIMKLVLLRISRAALRVMCLDTASSSEASEENTQPSQIRV